MYSNVLVIVSQIMKKIKSYAFRLNKDASSKELTKCTAPTKGEVVFYS